MLRRHIAGLAPFANQTIGIHVTGADLKNWLEQAAQIFIGLAPDHADQLLANPDIGSYQFDTIFGLHYEIDPFAPPHAGVTQTTHAVRPVAAAQGFAGSELRCKVARRERIAYIGIREVGAGRRLANPVRSGRKQP